MESYNSPLDMVQKSIGTGICVRTRHRTTVEGTLVGYDDHLNMMLENAQVTAKEGQIQLRRLMYLRGDTVILIAKK